MKPFIPIAFLASLAACQSGGQGPTPKAVVASLQLDLTAIDRLAIHYVTLPRCGPKVSAVCSTEDGAMAVKQAGENAYIRLLAAKAAIDGDPEASSTETKAAIAAANAAIASLNAIIPSKGR